MNPKLRKIWRDAYAVAEYPAPFPKLKNACSMWSYRQPTSRGWCQLSPHIGCRFDSKSKLNMIGPMLHIEEAMWELAVWQRQALDDPLAQKVMTSRVAWTAAVGIGLITKVFAVAKSAEGQDVDEQGGVLLEECAASLAKKVRVVMRMWGEGAIFAVAEIKDRLPRCQMHRFVNPANSNPRMSKAYKHAVGEHVPEHVKLGDDAQKEEGLAPKVIQFDCNGAPNTEHDALATKKSKDVDVIKWATWLHEHGRSEQRVLGQAVLAQACVVLRCELPSPDLAIFRDGKHVFVKAANDIVAGQLVATMGISEHTSKLM